MLLIPNRRTMKIALKYDAQAACSRQKIWSLIDRSRMQLGLWVDDDGGHSI